MITRRSGLTAGLLAASRVGVRLDLRAGLGEGTLSKLCEDRECRGGKGVRLLFPAMVIDQSRLAQISRDSASKT